MKNNNKLAINSIRARKAQKKRANEQDKPKKGKRWYSRLFALVGCLLLVSALALPCFADYNPTPNPDDGAPGVSDDNDGQASPPYTDAEIVRSFLSYMSVADTEPLYKLMTYGAYIPSENPWVFQFNVNTLSIETMQFISYTDYPLNADGDVYCYYRPTRSYYIINDGWWSVTNTTVDGYKYVYFDFFTLMDGMDMLQLRISIKANNSTGVIDNVEYVFTQYGTFDGQNMLCSTAVHADNITPLAYGLNTGLLLPYRVPLTNFEDYKAGYLVSYSEGYAEGRQEWYERGLDEGYYLGYTIGYMQGYDKGYDDGEIDGYNDGYAAGSDENTAYQRGYDDAVRQISDGDFGRNFLGGLFSAPLEGLRQFTLIEWVTANGATIRIDIMTVFSALVGVLLFIWFLRIFAGG